MHLKISSAKNGHFVQGEMSFQEARFILTDSTVVGTNTGQAWPFQIWGLFS